MGTFFKVVGWVMATISGVTPLEHTSRNPSNHQLRYGRGIHLLRAICRCGSNG